MTHSWSRLALAALLLLAPRPSRAQAIAPPSVPQDLDVPLRQMGGSAAVDEGAAALPGVNPAGLVLQPGFELDYLHQNEFRVGGFRADGLYASAAYGHLALGLGRDWLDVNGGCFGGPLCSSRWHLGAAVGSDALSLGSSLHLQKFGASGEVARWDVGAIARPLRQLSIGFSVRDWNRASVWGGQLPVRWSAALGLRPLGDWLTLGAETGMINCGGVPSGPCGIKNLGLRGSVSAEVGGGVSLTTAMSHAEDGTVRIVLGARWDLGHFAAAYGRTLGDAGPGNDLQLRVRSVSSANSFTTAAPRRILVDLDRELRDPEASLPEIVFGGTRKDRLAQLIARLDALPARAGAEITFRTSGLPFGAGQAAELKQSIERLRARGIRTKFFLESGGDREYDVALAADQVLTAPQAVLTINGYSATALFAGAGLDKLGVKAEFIRVGAYKNAPDTFTRGDMSKEQREVEESLLGDVYGRSVRWIAQRRKLDEAKVRALLDRGLLAPQDAVREGLFDGVSYPDQLEEPTGQARSDALPELPDEGKRQVRWTPKPQVAVIRVEGEILHGRSKRSPFGVAKVAGSETLIRRIRAAVDDPDVAALVLRVDSPGGDGNASDLIWRELVRAKEKKKPVVASLGDVAASGGYYVAVAADAIVAEPSTITGSIGVFVGKFDATALLDKLGLNLVTVKKGESADLFEPNRSLSTREHQMMQGWVDQFYAQFVDRVAQGRKLTAAQVDAAGRGRVYTGQQALALGLVDGLGGLTDAVAEAARRAQLSPSEFDVRDEEPLEAGASALGLSAQAGQAPLELLPAPLREGGARTLRALELLGAPGTVRACLPYDIELH